MSPRKRFSGTGISRVLEKNGFQVIRQKGSHRVLQKKLNSGTITVPIPMHKDLKPGTLASIIRQSRLSKDLFES